MKKKSKNIIFAKNKKWEEDGIDEIDDIFWLLGENLHKLNSMTMKIFLITSHQKIHFYTIFQYILSVTNEDQSTGQLQQTNLTVDYKFNLQLGWITANL